MRMFLATILFTSFFAHGVVVFHEGVSGKLELPSQSGNSGKFLSTDGSAMSWAEASGGGSGADTSLSNLASPTAVNRILTFSSSLATGGLLTPAGSSAADTNSVEIKTGNHTGNNTNKSGPITIATGTKSTGTGESGALTLATGQSSGASGLISLSTGNTSSGNGNTGNISIVSGESTVAQSGSLAIQTGNTNHNGTDSATGSMTIKTGNVTSTDESAQSGTILMQTGTTDAAYSGSIQITTGSSQYQSGDVFLVTGDGEIANDAYSGHTYVRTGNVTGTAIPGSIYIETGTSVDNASGGDIEITARAPSGTGLQGLITMVARALILPVLSADPSSPADGAIYYNSTSDLLKIFADGGWFALGGKHWYINASLGGADPSLGVGNVTTYTGITDAGMTLTPIDGSAAVGVMCSSTNAATAPSTSPTTCAAGDESVGFNFVLPPAHSSKRGTYDVCANMSVSAGVDAGVAANPAFQWVETATNAQTILTESKGIQQFNMNGAAANQNLGGGTRLCGRFNFTAKSAGDTVGIRLMYEMSVTGTPDYVVLVLDEDASNGQRNLNITVDHLD